MLTYHINLNERGSFLADVRRDEETIFEIKAGNELTEDETSVFEDGFMEHERDVAGLESYLIHLGLITEDETLEFA